MGVLIELVLALSILTLLLSPVWYWYNAWETKREILYSKERIKNFQKVFDDAFNLIIDHVRVKCLWGFQDASCLNTLPYPSNITNNGTNLIVEYSIDTNLPDRSELVNSIFARFKTIDCNLSLNSGSTVRFLCPNVNVVSSYTIPLTSLDNPFPLEFRMFRSNGTFKDFVVDIPSYERRKVLNEELFKEIANALKEYHLRRRIEEASNPCQPNGGLNSQDDIYIPWIMQAYTSNLNALCNTSTTTSCSCTNITWNTVNQDDDTQMVYLLNATLGLPFYAGYLGNKLKVYAIVDSSDNPFTPPNPQPNYPLKPPYFGLIKLDINHPCVTNKEPHCYYKFAYPN